MIEKIIYDYLKQETQCPVYMEAPKEPPVKYVVIQKTGSMMKNRIKTATIAVQSIDETLYKAADLSGKVIDLLLNASLEHLNVFGIELDTDYNFTNTTTKEYRYQAVFSITYKE